MKALSIHHIRFFSLYILRPIRPVTINNTAYNIFEKNMEEMGESNRKAFFMRTFALILVVYSMLPHQNSVSLRFCTTCSFKTLYKLPNSYNHWTNLYSMTKACSKRVSTLKLAL